MYAEYSPGGTGFSAAGETVYGKVPLLPDLPPALLTGKPISFAALSSILADNSYSGYSIVAYRFPAQSLQPELRLVKESNGTWQVNYSGPQRYEPSGPYVYTDEAVKMLFSYVIGERIFPAEIEFIGDARSQRRVWVRLC